MVLSESINENIEKHTMDVLTKIANSIDPEIQMEPDSPSKYSNGRMPVLDLSVWMENGILRHSFYKKPMASPYVILNSLRISGYNEEFRYNMMKGILEREIECERLISKGERVRYRSGEQIRSQKNTKLGISNNTWYLRGKWTNVVQVQCTPDGILRSMIQDKIDKVAGPDKGYTKVIESTGCAVTLGVKKNPFKTNECRYRGECFAKDTDCSKSRTVYRIECLKCKKGEIKAWYTGTSGCSLHKRLTEHKNAMDRKDPKNALAKHMTNEHPNEEPKFEAKIIDSQKFNLHRYVSESLHIEETTKDKEVKVLNSKAEWGRQKLTRIHLLDYT